VYAMGSQIDKVPMICRGWADPWSGASVTTAPKGNGVARNHLGEQTGKRIGGAAFDIGVK
jgi:hypothetical protein